MRIAIITVNYNNAEKTINFLRSVSQNSDVIRIVVDNASKADDRAALRTHIEQHDSSAILVESETNLGFSGGNNLGIQTAEKYEPEWYVFLNNDTVASEGFLDGLLQELKNKEGVVGIPLREGDKTAYAGRVEWLKPTLRHYYQPDLEENFYIIGGGVAVHKNVFHEIGYWDDRFFLYFEDVDLSLRAKEAGFPLNVLKNISLAHASQSTTKKLGVSILLRYHFRNTLLFNALHAPWPVKLILPFWSIWTILKQLVKLVIMPQRRGIAMAIMAGVFDFYIGKFGKIL